MSDIKVPHHHGFTNTANLVVLWTLVVWVSLRVEELTNINICVSESPRQSPWKLQRKRRRNEALFLSMFVVGDWQLALFEVCSCVRVFEVGWEKRQWHLSCALNIWRGFKQSNISAKAGDDRTIQRVCHQWGKWFSFTVTTVTISPSSLVSYLFVLPVCFLLSSSIHFFLSLNLTSPLILHLLPSPSLSLCIFHPTFKRKLGLSLMMKKTSFQLLVSSLFVSFSTPPTLLSTLLHVLKCWPWGGRLRLPLSLHLLCVYLWKVR